MLRIISLVLALVGFVAANNSVFANENALQIDTASCYHHNHAGGGVYFDYLIVNVSAGVPLGEIYTLVWEVQEPGGAWRSYKTVAITMSNYYSGTVYNDPNDVHSGGTELNPAIPLPSGSYNIRVKLMDGGDTIDIDTYDLARFF
jgi:hypothetical protein